MFLRPWRSDVIPENWPMRPLGRLEVVPSDGRNRVWRRACGNSAAVRSRRRHPSWHTRLRPIRSSHTSWPIRGEGASLCRRSSRPYCTNWSTPGRSTSPSTPEGWPGLPRGCHRSRRRRVETLGGVRVWRRRAFDCCFLEQRHKFGQASRPLANSTRAARTGTSHLSASNLVSNDAGWGGNSSSLCSSRLIATATSATSRLRSPTPAPSIASFASATTPSFVRSLRHLRSGR
jgi:hypothetical protein